MRHLRSLLNRLSLSAAGERARHVIELALSDRCYPLILALGGVVLLVKLVREVITHEMAYLYLEYLVDYEFGFIRRGLAGELLSLALPRLTHVHVKVLAVATIAMAFGAYLAMFARRFGLRRRELPLLVCTIVSPCVFKNFAHDLPRLDVLGFLGAILALWLPVNRAYSLTLGAVCCLLGVLHEGQFLTYVPVIAAIAALRLLAQPDRPTGLPWREVLALLAILVTFLLVLRFGGADVPQDVFLAHVRAKAVDSVIDRTFIWYTDIAGNMRVALTAQYLWPQLYRSPVYLLILVAHLPLLCLVRGELRDAPRQLRAALWVGLLAVTAGGLVMSMIGHDRARFFANGLTGIILIVHAVRLVRPQADPELDSLRTQPAMAAAWVLAVFSRVGLMTP